MYDDFMPPPSKKPMDLGNPSPLIFKLVYDIYIYSHIYVILISFHWQYGKHNIVQYQWSNLDEMNVQFKFTRIQQPIT